MENKTKYKEKHCCKCGTINYAKKSNININDSLSKLADKYNCYVFNCVVCGEHNTFFDLPEFGNNNIVKRKKPIY